MLRNMGAQSGRNNASGLKPLAFLRETLKSVKGSVMPLGSARVAGAWTESPQLAWAGGTDGSEPAWAFAVGVDDFRCRRYSRDNRGAVVLLAKLPNEVATNTHIVRSPLDTTLPI